VRTSAEYVAYFERINDVGGDIGNAAKQCVRRWPRDYESIVPSFRLVSGVRNFSQAYEHAKVLSEKL
jgi:hypothetical protein